MAANEASLKKRSSSEPQRLQEDSKENIPSVESDVQEDDAEKMSKKEKEEMSPKILLNISILISINLLNYMERFTVAVAGVLTNIQEFFGIEDAQGGLLQSAFMVSFMISSPVCGFLGDRYKRKWIIAAGITMWVSAVFASTFTPTDRFWIFPIFRGIVGMGEASYATIAPSIIADMFTSENRSRMLMIFYCAMPFGSGLGFIVGSKVAALTGQWEWGMRITVIFGIVCLVMIVIFLEEPERGAAELEKGERETKVVATSYWEDIRGLATTITYVFGTVGYTAIIFMVGTLSWWGPATIEHSDAHKLGLNTTSELDPGVKAKTNSIFGAITCVGGIVGVGLGSSLSMMLRSGYGPFKCVRTIRSDPIICGVGALIAAPTLYLSFYLIPVNMAVAWIFVFITITATCFNWATNVDMVMAVIIPTRRNAAVSYQILLSHMFGDALSPYIVGKISDRIRGDDLSPNAHFHSLVTSFYLPNALLIVATIMYFCAAYTFVKDNNKFKDYMGVPRTAPVSSVSLQGDVPQQTYEPQADDDNQVLKEEQEQ